MPQEKGDANAPLLSSQEGEQTGGGDGIVRTENHDAEITSFVNSIDHAERGGRFSNVNWNNARRWISGDDDQDPEASECRTTIKDLTIGLGLIIASPLAVAGVALAGAATILYGVGKFVEGVGRAISWPGKKVIRKLNQQEEGG
jgi:hypothetical protein